MASISADVEVNRYALPKKVVPSSKEEEVPDLSSSAPSSQPRLQNENGKGSSSSDAATSSTPSTSLSIASAAVLAAAGGEATSCEGAATKPGCAKSAASAVDLGSVEPTGHFTFSVVKGKSTIFPPTKEIEKKFSQWGLKTHCVHRVFRFDEPLPQGDDESTLGVFLTDFFNDKTVQSSLELSTSSNKLVPCIGGQVESVKFDVLRATQLNMGFFDKIQSQAEIVRNSGYISKCLDEIVEGVTVSDRLATMFVCEETEEYEETFSEEEKKEFLYHLLHRVVIGGSLCQPEEKWDEYLVAVKALYRHFVTVSKNSLTGKLQITSKVLQIKAVKGDIGIFPDEEQMHNFCYVVIDRARRTIKYWCTAFVSWW